MIEAQTTNSVSVDPRDGAAAAFEVIAYRAFCLADRATWRVESRVAREGELCQSMHFGSGVGAATRDLKVQAFLTAATSFVSESLASPNSMIVFGS